MPKLIFSENWRLGIAVMDSQHETLIDLINRLYDAVMEGHDAEVIDDIASEAYDYIGKHFETEQALMEEHEYPGQKAHEDEHEDYILKSSEYLMDSGEGREGLAGDVLDYLMDWWVLHINGTDMDLAEYLKRQGVS